MPLLPSASDSEPFLILTDQDYQKAIEPEVPAPVPSPPPVSAPAPKARAAKATPRPRPAPPAEARPAAPRWGLRIAASVLVLAGAGAAFWWTTRPVAEPPAVVVATPVVAEPPPKVEPPPVKPEPPPPKPESPPLEPPVVEEKPAPIVPPPPPPSPAASRGTWQGGRAWVRVHLTMENRGQVQELTQRAVIVWDGQQFAVKPPPGGRLELWMDRLQLLLNLPWPEESWQRAVTTTRAEKLGGEGRSFDCDRVEGEDRFPQQRRPFVYWTSPDFPAGALRAKVTFPELSVEMRVLGYGPDPGGE